MRTNPRFDDSQGHRVGTIGRTARRDKLHAVKQMARHCDRNQAHILDVLREAFADVGSVLEIGSGSGQHAAYFASNLPRLQWTPSDLVESHPSIQAWRDELALANLHAPLALDVDDSVWPGEPFDAIFTANTLHIMGWPSVVNLFAHAPLVLRPGGLLCIYGPFNYGGCYTSPGNEAFDARLQGDDPVRGIRDFERIDALALAHGMRLRKDYEMPANNRILLWVNKSDE